MRRPRRPAQDLRFAIGCLPRRTREAMLEGIESTDIIVGAYTDRDGGVCPMLAAHRHGGRTALASFARAWDRYTRAAKGARRATPREIRALRAMLEGSLVADDSPSGELAAAAAELREIMARRAAAADRVRDADRRRAGAPGEPEPGGVSRRGPRTGERDRSPELRGRPGWAWLRVFRRLDDYEAALARARRAEDAPERRTLERV